MSDEPSGKSGTDTGLSNAAGGHNVRDTTGQTPVIRLTEAEVNYMTGLLVKLPYENAAPIIQILGRKLMEQRNNGS